MYLNTDLEMLSRIDPSPLSAELDARADLLYGFEGSDRRWRLCAEAPGSGVRGEGRTPAVDVRLLLDIVDSLSPEARAVWDACEARVLNVGWFAPERRPAEVVRFERELLERVARAGVGLEVTVYPAADAADANEPSGP